MAHSYSACPGAANAGRDAGFYVGMRTRSHEPGREETREISALWKDFIKRSAEIRQVPVRRQI